MEQLNTRESNVEERHGNWKESMEKALLAKFPVLSEHLAWVAKDCAPALAPHLAGRFEIRAS